MTIKELRQLMRGLPPSMQVVIGIANESLEDICYENTGVLVVQYNDNGNKEPLFVLAVCECDKVDAPEVGEINGQPELN